MPQTPISAFPQTPVPQTPGVAAAQGWMEDIKRVISFDSVEEFWGCVRRCLNYRSKTFGQPIQQHCSAVATAAKGQLLPLQSECCIKCTDGC
jgi:hypothetical protein